MDIKPTRIPDVLHITPVCFRDDRGFFMESYNDRLFQEKTGISLKFVQDNHSRSCKNVLRGLHYQVQQAQGKLIRVVRGEIFDVAVDLRSDSSTFGEWVGCILSAENRQQLWIPPGFAHGFCILSNDADVLYKTTDYYAPAHERTLRWNDSTIGVTWPIEGEPILSLKDQQGKYFKDCDYFISSCE